jgi:hypothetical protein
MYENRTTKSTEIVLRRGEGGERRNREEVNLIKIDCKHLCKYHNAPPKTIIC